MQIGSNNMTQAEPKPLIKYSFFLIVFITSFILIKVNKIELFGLGLFFIINILFCIFIGKELTDGITITSEKKSTEYMLRFGSLIVGVAFSFVSTIMMIMTFVTLHSKFAETDSEIKWSASDRRKLDITEILFITTTTFIGVTALYVLNNEETIRKTTYNIFETILNGPAANLLRVIFPIVILAVGSALYGRLNMPPIEVKKKPTSIICNPQNDLAIRPFKKSFINTFWLIVAYFIVIFSRPFIEANFKIESKNGDIHPSMPFGFPTSERQLIFGQNPAISVIYLLNIILIPSIVVISLMGAKNMTVFISLLTIIIGVWVIDGVTVLNQIGLKFDGMNLLFSMLCILFSPLTLLITKSKPDKSNPILSFLYSSALRWDVMYSLTKYGLGFAGLLFAGFSIKQFSEIPNGNECFYTNTHIRQLYIAFIVFLITFYTFNTLSVTTITYLTTNIMRYLVPPALLGISSYLIFITDYFVNMAPKLVIQ